VQNKNKTPENEKLTQYLPRSSLPMDINCATLFSPSRTNSKIYATHKRYITIQTN